MDHHRQLGASQLSDQALHPGAAIIGGFHLSGPMFERIIEPTVDALAELSPSLLVPAHCTGWRAVHRLATRFPDAFVMSTVGTTISPLIHRGWRGSRAGNA